MRVLILSPFFHPEAISTGRYNTVLAQELVRRGLTLEVIASHPLYPGWRPESSDGQLPGMHIHRGGAWMRYPRRQALRRMLLETWFAVHVAIRLIWAKPRVSHVIVVFPPNLVALILPWLLPRGVRKVGIVHDLQGVLARARWIRWAVHWTEKRAFAVCDRLIFLSHSMANRAIAEYGVEASRIVVCYPFLTMREVGRNDGVLADVLPDGLVHVVYSGALGDKQDPDGLVGFMRGLASRHLELRCHIFSAGPHFERLSATAAATGDSGVAFHGLVPDGALGELYARSTVQILPQAKGTADGALPSKLPNLIAAGVPVFVICDPDSEAALLLRQAGEGAGSHVSEFDCPDTYVRFDEFLKRVRGEGREARIRRQRVFVERMFGVQDIVTDILNS